MPAALDAVVLAIPPRRSLAMLPLPGFVSLKSPAIAASKEPRTRRKTQQSLALAAIPGSLTLRESHARASHSQQAKKSRTRSKTHRIEPRTHSNLRASHSEQNVAESRSFHQLFIIVRRLESS